MIVVLVGAAAVALALYFYFKEAVFGYVGGGFVAAALLLFYFTAIGYQHWFAKREELQLEQRLQDLKRDIDKLDAGLDDVSNDEIVPEGSYPDQDYPVTR